MHAERPLRLEIVTSSGDESLLIVDRGENTVALEDSAPVRLETEEMKLIGMLATEPNVPFTLHDIRRELDDIRLNPLKLIEGSLKKAPFLRRHPLAIVYHKTQYYSFLDRAGNTEDFEHEFEKKLKQERYLGRDPETKRPQFSEAKDLLRRHARRRKIVKAALGATAASSAIIGYAARKHYK